MNEVLFNSPLVRGFRDSRTGDLAMSRGDTISHNDECSPLGYVDNVGSRHGPNILGG
jgi:hypothetical protein